MEKRLVPDEIRDLSILISKKLFQIVKLQEMSEYPSPLQAKILFYLMNNKDKVIYQKDLENEFNVSKVTISEAIKKMEKNNMICRVSSENDARSKQISCSEVSISRIKEMHNNIFKLNQELLKDISEEEINIFFKTIDKMKMNIKDN